MTRDRKRAETYVTEEQLERWDERADEFGMSRSRFIADMVEAGIKADKGFSTDVELDETARELRQQRNDLKRELQHARSRIEALEEQVHSGEREAIEEYVREHPGADFDDIVRHVLSTVPERVNRHLEDMEGEVLQVDPESGGYYPDDVDVDATDA